MSATLITTIISALLSAIISSVISYKVANKKNVKAEEGRLNEQVLALNKISIEYPYFEDVDYCKTWLENRNSKDEKHLRYDIYCCIVFNLLEQIYKLYNGDDIKIENFIHIKELIQKHKFWWESPMGTLENINGYDPDFRKYIKKLLEKFPSHTHST